MIQYAILMLFMILPTPIPQPSQTAPPDIVAPTSTPVPLLVNGQVIDFERGYIVFSSGDAFKLAANVSLVDEATGAAPSYAIAPGLFAVAYLDTESASVTSVHFARKPLPQGTPAADVPRKYVAQLSPSQPNPDLAPRAATFQSKLSKDTLVRITVQVPPNTPFTDDVYITTDTSGWNPQAIKMQKADGLHYYIEVRLKTGTEFHFLFTRGSWKSAERDRAGLERKPRSLVIEGADAMRVDPTVYRWADLN
ncbi:MAG TPA: hypothetical protein VN934_11110 [Candidatus Tumulicola sp.]|nr:hypothetical protein [Candidatus Tumulicola sp.]